MGRFLAWLFHVAVPRFTTFYFLELFNGEKRVIQVISSPDEVQDYYQDRIIKVRTFLFLGKPYFSRLYRQ